VVIASSVSSATGSCLMVMELAQQRERLRSQAARTMVAEPTVAEKRCTKCRELKSAADFFRFKFSSDGLQSYCKVMYLFKDFHHLASLPVA